MKYEKEIKQFIGDHVKYDEWGGGYIWGVIDSEKKDQINNLQMIGDVVGVNEPSMKDGETPVVSVRGWGAVKHLFKTEKECEEFQDELGQFIADAINKKLKKI